MPRRPLLGRGGDLSLDGRGREEARRLRLAHLGRVARAVEEEDEALDLADVRILGSAPVVAGAERVADAVEEIGLLLAGGGGLSGS